MDILKTVIIRLWRVDRPIALHFYMQKNAINYILVGYGVIITQIGSCQAELYRFCEHDK